MSAGALDFSLCWSGPDKWNGCLTTAHLKVLIDHDAIWPVGGASQIDLEIQVDDLLSHLTEFWKPLILRQTYPIPVAPERPSLLRSEAERRWEMGRAADAERENDRITAFEEAHDLSRCFAGLFDLPSIWFLRAGDRMLIDTRTALYTVPFEQARKALSDVGEEIAKRLEDAEGGRWSELLAAWRSRDQGDPAVLLAWSASLDRNVARSFVNDGTLDAPTNVTEAANDNDELRIAARMASALPAEQIRQIIELARSFPKRVAPKLDDLADCVRAYVDSNFSSHRAHEQGEAAANFVREQFGLASVQFVDIYSLIEGLGTSVVGRGVEPSTLDALAVWGKHHGPGVLLNVNSLRARTGQNIQNISRNWACRVTLAHELCHLILDRWHALSAVEVLNSRMPPHIERRAKAFAGELLLPSRVAAEIWTANQAPRSTDGLKALINTLCRRYGVTRSVAAWKLEHGLHRRDIDVRVLLDAVVPQR
jgi:IrrE N-terminal-like domain